MRHEWPVTVGWSPVVSIASRLGSWPLIRQITDGDPLGLGKAVRSRRSETLRPRIDEADTVARSVCPYCAVGCGQLVYVKHGEVVQIEGDPGSPISRGRLCPKGAASLGYVKSPLREYKVKYRRPHGTEWEELPLEQAMDMIADRVVDTRAGRGRRGRRGQDDATHARASRNLGGATLDNEENYLIKKLITALGVVQVENQARI